MDFASPVTKDVRNVTRRLLMGALLASTVRQRFILVVLVFAVMLLARHVKA